MRFFINCVNVIIRDVRKMVKAKIKVLIYVIQPFLNRIQNNSIHKITHIIFACAKKA